MKKLLLNAAFFCGSLTILPAQIRLDSALANRIAQQLFSSMNGKGLCPKVYLKNDPRYASVINDSTIRIDSNRVIRRLAALGEDADDALAVIIGHELRHIMNGQYGQGFGIWEKNYGKKEMENDADQYGILAAFFAGYTNAVAVFDTIFNVLEINGLSDDYPSKTERQENNEKVKSRALEITRVYEAGNIFLASGSPEFLPYAIACYQHCIHKMLPMKELNYQIGLAKLFHGMYEMEKTKYWLPLTIQPSPFSRPGIKTSITLGKNLLKEAGQYFEKALKQDRSYFDAELGRICALMISDGSMPPPGVFPTDRCTPLERRKLKLLAAVSLLYDRQSETLGKEQLAALLQEDDLVKELAAANLSIYSLKGRATLNRPDLDVMDKVKNDIFNASGLPNKASQKLAVRGDYFYEVTDLKSSTLFLWKNKARPIAKIQTFRHFPTGISDLPELTSTAQSAGMWYYYPGTEYDVLIRPSATQEQWECIKIIHE